MNYAREMCLVAPSSSPFLSPVNLLRARADARFMSYSSSSTDANRSLLLAQQKQAYHVIKVGAVLFVVGFVITVGTFAAAKPGGTFIISWGPMVFGAIRVFKGYMELAPINGALSRMGPKTDYSQPYESGQSQSQEPERHPGASWFPDPSKRHELRYWDGLAWTPHVSNQGITAYDPA